MAINNIYDDHAHQKLVTPHVPALAQITKKKLLQ